LRPVTVFLLLCCICPGSSLHAQSASPASQYFFNKASFPTGKSPAGLALADMNQDGRPDLVVANSQDRTVSILLGQADGTFGAKTDFALDDPPWALVTGDFNGDGKTDVAVGGYSSVIVLPGQGDGTLGTATSYPSSNQPFLLAAADFNQDGKLDLAFAGICGDTCGQVSVLLGKGDGTFTAGSPFSAGGVPSEWTVADLNGDGVADLAFANMASNSYNGGTGGLVSILLGKGDGTFQAPVNYPSSANIAGIAAGDVTGDKIPDLIVTSYAALQPTMLKGNGDGTFQAQVSISDANQVDIDLSYEHVQLLDVNKDGKLDLVVASGLDQGLTVRLGNGDGTFGLSQTYTAGSSPTFFTAADVSGDGNLDFAVTDNYGNAVGILLGNGDGTFSPRKNLLPDWRSAVTSAVIGDYNQDGAPDVAVTAGSGVITLLGKGDGTFPTSTVIAPGSSSYFGQLVQGDFNGDGHLDLIAYGTTFLAGKGDGSFGAPVTINTDFNIRSSVAGDFNNDGYLDLIDVGNEFEETEPMQVFLGKGDGTFQLVRRFWSSSQYPDKVVAADFNHDGNLDLALTLNSGGVAILLGTGGGSFSPPTVFATDELPSGIATTDLNGDGIADLIVVTDVVEVFLGKGDGTFPNRVDYPVGNFPSQVTTGDFNNDGKIDLAVTLNAGLPGQLLILFGNGDGTFQSPLNFSGNSLAGAPLVVADLNGDGVQDVLIAAEGGSMFLSGPLPVVSPSLLSFGTVALGTTSITIPITVTNVGNSALRLTSAVTDAPFSIAGQVCQSPLAWLANCEIPVVFAPTAPGQQTGQVAIQTEVSPAKLVVAVTGTAVAPSIQVTPASLNFSAQALGTTLAAQTVTISNTSGVLALLGSVTASGPFTATSQCGATLAAGANCSVTVTFTPTAIGQQTGSLTVSDDGTGGPQTIALSGSGAAVLSVSPQAGQPASATVAAGGVATYALVLNAGPGFAGTGAVSCSGAPQNASCTVDPASVSLAAGGTQNFSVTVTTSRQVASTHDWPGSLPFSGASLWIAAWVLPLIRRRSRVRTGLAMLPLLLALSLAGGCGGGGGSSTKPPAPQQVTSGTYQLTVTAAVAGAQASQTLTLVVQ
jgi:hypothetical protein